MKFVFVCTFFYFCVFLRAGQVLGTTIPITYQLIDVGTHISLHTEDTNDLQKFVPKASLANFEYLLNEVIPNFQVSNPFQLRKEIVDVFSTYSPEIGDFQYEFTPPDNLNRGLSRQRARQWLERSWQSLSDNAIGDARNNPVNKIIVNHLLQRLSGLTGTYLETHQFFDISQYPLVYQWLLTGVTLAARNQLPPDQAFELEWEFAKLTAYFKEASEIHRGQSFTQSLNNLRSLVKRYQN